MSITEGTLKLTLIDEMSPDLAKVLDMLPNPEDEDPSGAEAYTSEWLIDETMRDDPGLTRDQAIDVIRQAEREALAGGL